MNPEVFQEFNFFLDIGIELLFYLALLCFTIYAVFLSYHWFSYGTDSRTSMLSLAIFLIGATPFILSMALLM